MPVPKKILFVCAGNIIRSPLAEHLFKRLALQAGVADRFEVASAGTEPYHVGQEPDRRMQAVASSRGWSYTGRARQFTRSDFDRYDLILVMDEENRYDLLGWARHAQDREKIKMLRSFDPAAKPGEIVPDPYYGGLPGAFHRVTK